MLSVFPYIVLAITWMDIEILPLGGISQMETDSIKLKLRKIVSKMFFIHMKKDVVTLGNVSGQEDGEPHGFERKENWKVRLCGPHPTGLRTTVPRGHALEAWLFPPPSTHIPSNSTYSPSSGYVRMLFRNKLTLCLRN